MTNITLKKIQKEQWKLPEKEKLRIENILKRSIDVEKGSEKPSVTEEHPDGCMYYKTFYLIELMLIFLYTIVKHLFFNHYN